MKAKSTIVQTIVLLLALAVVTQAEKVPTAASAAATDQNSIKIEKTGDTLLDEPIFSGEIVQNVYPSAAYMKYSPFADCWQSDPLLLVLLALFTTVSLAALGFIFHLIRHDESFI